MIDTGHGTSALANRGPGQLHRGGTQGGLSEVVRVKLEERWLAGLGVIILR